MALIHYNGSVTANTIVVGGTGKGIFKDSADDDNLTTVNINFGTLSKSNPIYVVGESLTLGQGSAAATAVAGNGRQITTVPGNRTFIQDQARAAGAISSDQEGTPITAAVATQFEGTLAAGGATRLLISGHGKAQITLDDKVYTLALDELSFPFLHGGAIEVLPGSIIQYIGIVNSTTTDDVNFSPVTYYSGASAPDTQAISLNTGQGLVSISDTNQAEEDITIRLNHTEFPLVLDATQSIEFKGTGVGFGYETVTV